MEDPYSVSSPRRILSLSKKRRATISFLAADERTSGFGVSGEHGPKPSEVYGFVGSITTVITTEDWLHSIGISYYPSRHWALTVPAYFMVTVVLALGFYIGLNFMSTPSPTSLNIMFDEFSSEPLSSVPSVDGDEQPIKSISDIGINKINYLMFNKVN
ncbi:hypothetical protein ACB094_11G135900 [Castanea mollissima]